MLGDGCVGMDADTLASWRDQTSVENFRIRWEFGLHLIIILSMQRCHTAQGCLNSVESPFWCGTYFDCDYQIQRQIQVDLSSILQMALSLKEQAVNRRQYSSILNPEELLNQASGSSILPFVDKVRTVALKLCWHWLLIIEWQERHQEWDLVSHCVVVIFWNCLLTFHYFGEIVWQVTIFIKKPVVKIHFHHILKKNCISRTIFYSQ